MSGYIGTQPVPQATQTRDAFTCTAGQTSFATGGYTPQFLDVYLNGIKLAAADYTASNGSDVVLASGAALDDILEVVAYSTFEVVTDTVTKAGTVLNLDRTGSDGTILDLQKDGYTVGSIGSVSTDSDATSDLYIGGDNTGIRLGVGSDVSAVVPCLQTTGALRNGVTSLGSSNARFKDLYLSGGVYLGGTGAANKLDDYEEGTWTPVFDSTWSEDSWNNATGLAIGYADYTKVGNAVTLFGSIKITGQTAGTLVVSSNVTVSGLPFNVSPVSTSGFNAQRGCGTFHVYTSIGSGHFATGSIIAYTNKLIFTVTAVSASGVQAHSEVFFTYTYEVT
jgi:hypothetical protein